MSWGMWGLDDDAGDQPAPEYRTAAIDRDVAEDLRKLGARIASDEDDDSWIPRKENGSIDIPKYMEIRKTRPQKPEPLTKTLYHITDNPDFALDPDRQPTEGKTWGSGPRMKNGIFLTHMPSYWKPWGKRPYVVSLEVPTGLANEHRPRLGDDPEHMISSEHFPKLKINKVMTWPGYEQETRHKWAVGDPNPWNLSLIHI